MNTTNAGNMQRRGMAGVAHDGGGFYYRAKKYHFTTGFTN